MMPDHDKKPRGSLATWSSDIRMYGVLLGIATVLPILLQTCIKKELAQQQQQQQQQTVEKKEIAADKIEMPEEFKWLTQTVNPADNFNITSESLGINDIKGLINRDILEKSIAANNGLRGAIAIRVAVNIMKYLDNFYGDFDIVRWTDATTPYDIIHVCDDQNYTADLILETAVINTVTRCHKQGWKFYIAARSGLNVDNDKFYTQLINNICDAPPLTTRDEALAYVDSLRARHHRQERLYEQNKQNNRNPPTKKKRDESYEATN